VKSLPLFFKVSGCWAIYVTVQQHDLRGSNEGLFGYEILALLLLSQNGQHRLLFRLRLLSAICAERLLSLLIN